MWFLESFPDAAYCHLMFLLRWSMWFPSCGLGAESQSLPSSYGPLELCRLGSLGHGYHRTLFFQTQNWMRRWFMKWMGYPRKDGKTVPVHLCRIIYLYTIWFDLSTTITQQPDLEVVPSFLNSLLQWKFPNRWCCPDMKNAKSHTIRRINHVLPGWRKLTHFDLW